MPFVSGHVQIEIGDDVYIGGKVAIISGGILESPRLILGNGSELGWNVSITVNKEVVIEDHARIAFDCRISDSDAHPREADLRAANKPPRIEDIKPVRICRNAWIGNGAHVMKGVTIGEGAIIGANSVVISDVPPFCMAAGNPARVYLKDFGRPSTFQQPET
ncbi:MAG TPA: acyltransferase [Bryobacteraceae bacterium]